MDKIKQINWPLVAFVLLGLRAVVDASFGQAAVALCLGTYVAYTKWLEHKKAPSLEDQVRQELTAIKSQMSGLMIKNSVKKEDSAPVRWF